MRKFNREKFLFRMLAAIFIVEALFIGAGFYKCFSLTPKDYQIQCSKLGDRTETLFGIAIATTLSLLGAGAMANSNK